MQMQLINMTRGITDVEIPDAEAVGSAGLIRIHRRRLNRLPRKLCPLTLAPCRPPCLLGYKEFKTFLNLFCSHCQHRQSTMHHSSDSRFASNLPATQYPVIQPQLRAMLINSREANLTPRARRPEGPPLVLASYGSHRKTALHRGSIVLRTLQYGPPCQPGDHPSYTYVAQASATPQPSKSISKRQKDGDLCST